MYSGILLLLVFNDIPTRVLFSFYFICIFFLFIQWPLNFLHMVHSVKLDTLTELSALQT